MERSIDLRSFWRDITGGRLPSRAARTNFRRNGILTTGDGKTALCQVAGGGCFCGFSGASVPASGKAKGDEQAALWGVRPAMALRAGKGAGA